MINLLEFSVITATIIRLKGLKGIIIIRQGVIKGLEHSVTSINRGIRDRIISASINREIRDRVIRGTMGQGTNGKKGVSRDYYFTNS